MLHFSAFSSIFACKAICKSISYIIVNMDLVGKRLFSTTRNVQIIKPLTSTLKNVVPKKFERTEIVKPVGQVEKPKVTDGIDNRSFTQRKNDWLDDSNRLKRKANLEREFATSGMYDMHIFRKTQGKVFLSPKSYFKREKSLYFPNFIADENLKGKKQISTYGLFTNEGKLDKINIVRISSSAVGQKFTKKYFEYAHNGESGNYLTSNESYKKLVACYPDARVVNFEIYDNVFLKWIFKYFASKNIIKNSITLPEYSENYLIINKKYLDVPTKDSLHYLNGITGYIYIVDNEGKIRWLSCGDPTESDIQTMWKTVLGIQAELRKKSMDTSI